MTDEIAAWTVPPEQRPACPLDGHPCTSWTCLVDVCADPGETVPPGYRTREAARTRAQVGLDLTRQVLEALCRRDGLSLESEADPGTPARNCELAIRLGIGEVFGVG